ncbi:hypothetical protein [Microviridae sp.]|nr:hypothetical protein [Microviridae sp.]
MRRKSRGYTGRRASSFSKAGARLSRSARQPATNTRRNTEGRGNARKTSKTIYARHSSRRTTATPKRSRSLESARSIRNQLQTRSLHRRTDMREPGKTTVRRLSSTILPLRRDNENASDKQTTRSVCTRKKQAKRATIIATGYGGKNGFTNYKQHRKC